MHATMFKQGFVLQLYSISFNWNAVAPLTILEVVCWENCVQENKSSLLGPENKVPSHGVIFPTFQKKKNSHFNAIWMPFCTFFKQLGSAKLLRFEEHFEKL